ncbi:hypothetical protein B0H34DRAFT_260339 [Crassisporium funariophilum]|nr:hypothetical protein B0H34DRAFT_260339 [Crassisporium funariophilum]
MFSSASSSGSSSRRSGSSVTDYTSSTLTCQSYHPLPARLQDDIQGKHSCDVTLFDFVTRVWGIDPDVAGHILSSKGWTVLPEPLRLYSAALREPQMYVPFAEIAESLVKDARKEVREFLTRRKATLEAQTGMETSIYFWSKLGDRILKSALTKRKPDMLVVKEKVVDVTPTWLLVRQVIEFKRKSKPLQGIVPTASSSDSAYPPSLNPTASGSSAAGSSSGIRVPEVSSVASSASGTKRSRTSKAKNAAPRRTTRSKDSTTPATASSGGRSADPALSAAGSQKRKNSGTHGGGDAKRVRTSDKVPKVTPDQVQLAIYALECLDASTRHYASGVFIDRFKVSLWYYDRSCVISSVSFDFHSNPEQLALVLYALSACDDKHAGFDPLLVLPATRSPRPEDHLHWQDIVDAEIDLRTLNPSSERGRFRLEDTLFAYRGLMGRGTMVYQVTPLIDGLKDCNSEALKISWPPLTRPLEADTIQRLHERLQPQWREHIPEVTFSATQTAEQLNLPRVELLKTNPIDKFEDQLLHALAMKLYGKLWDVGSVEAFQGVFVDCVECHYHAYVDAKVLHRDLSENNLMFKRGDAGTVKGILNDWDMASYVEANNEIPLSTATHRTGTIPFMAHDLLADDDPPPHLFRHDLESFYYILVWAALHYDFSGKRRLPIVPAVKNWDASTFETARNDKKVFISHKRERNQVFGNVPLEHEALLPWLTSVGVLFHKGYMSEQQDSESPGWDNNTLGGHITFHNFMAALGRIPR